MKFNMFQYYILTILYIREFAFSSTALTIGYINITKESYVMYKELMVRPIEEFAIKAIISKHTKDEEECLELCMTTNGCQSINHYETCKLLNSTDMSAKHMDKRFVHIAMRNRGCDSGKCKNGATCVPIFKNDTFVCKCLPTFYGTFCEMKRKVEQPNIWFKFRGDTTNYGSSPQDATVLAVQDAYGAATFIRQPMHPTYFMFCRAKCTNNNFKWPALGNPDLSPNGGTISFWIRFHKDEELRQSGYNKRSHILAQNGKGLGMYYSNELHAWEYVSYGSKGVYCSITLSRDESLEWHFVALAFDSKGMTCCVNDVAYEKPHTGPFTIEAGDVLPVFQPLTGAWYDISDFKIWYHRLDVELIKSVYETKRDHD